MVQQKPPYCNSTVQNEGDCVLIGFLDHIILHGDLNHLQEYFSTYLDTKLFLSVTT